MLSATLRKWKILSVKLVVVVAVVVVVVVIAIVVVVVVVEIVAVAAACCSRNQHLEDDLYNWTLTNANTIKHLKDEKL